MDYFNRVALILSYCELGSIKYSFQTNYAGINGRHRLTVQTDDVLFTDVICYSDDKDFEEKILLIETFLGMKDKEDEQENN